MTRFPTHRHLSWAGLCPRLDESAGKGKSPRPRHSSGWLKTLLIQTAWTTIRGKNTYYRARFLRVKARGSVVSEDAFSAVRGLSRLTQCPRRSTRSKGQTGYALLFQ